MIGAGISYYSTAAQENYLAGNAKIYDGSFDADTINISTGIYEYNLASTTLLAFKWTPVVSSNRQHLFQVGDYGGGATRGVAFYIENGKLWCWFQNTQGVGIVISSDNLITDVYNIVCITKSTSSASSGIKIYINGVASPFSILFDSLNNNTLVPPQGNKWTIGARQGSDPISGRFGGLIKQIEVANFEATAGQITIATAQGSLQALSLPFADYLFSVDFNKTGTVAPTTRTGTPAYTITPTGGAAYTQYLP